MSHRDDLVIAAFDAFGETATYQAAPAAPITDEKLVIPVTEDAHSGPTFAPKMIAGQRQRFYLRRDLVGDYLRGAMILWSGRNWLVQDKDLDDGLRYRVIAVLQP